MAITRRSALESLLATPALIGRARAATRTLRISHQFPGGISNQSDFRDRLVRRFAAEVQRRTDGELEFEIYPGSSLMKTVAQFSALRRGDLDLTLYPLAYAGDEMIEVNIGLMPCLVTTYEQGMAWKEKPVGRELANLLDQRGVRILTWIWQAGGVASRNAFVVEPDDVRGLKIRGGSREMDLMLQGAGGITGPLPSNEIYAAMQTGALDAAVTSSTSLISFRLQEISKAITTGRTGSFWFMLEPLLISKLVYDSLTPPQRTAIDEVGLGAGGIRHAGRAAGRPEPRRCLCESWGRCEDYGRRCDRQMEGAGTAYGMAGFCRPQRVLRAVAEARGTGSLSIVGFTGQMRIYDF